MSNYLVSKISGSRIRGEESVMVVGYGIKGQTLTLDVANLNYTPTAYQWTSDGTNISGETSSTYVVTSDKEGTVISCKVFNGGEFILAAPVDTNIPSDYSDLVIWIDPSDTDTITEVSDRVSQIDDKSGNANHITQGTASLQPKTNTSTVNGLNVIDIDGVLDTYGYLTSSITLGSDNTTFLVMRTDAYLQNNAGPFGLRGTNNYWFFQNFNVSPNVRYYLNNSFGDNVNPVVSGLLNALIVFVIRVRYSGLDFTYRFESDTGLTFNTTNDYTEAEVSGETTFRYGYSNTLSYSDGILAESCVFDRALTDSEISEILSYLKIKWGL